MKDDYVTKLANNIEQKLDMSSSEIKKLSRYEFKNLLKHGYFSQKFYKGKRSTEPTNRQMDVLDLHYGKSVSVTKEAIFNVNKKYYNINKRTSRRYSPEYIRKNKAGRNIDSRTGRFVTTNKN